VSKPLRGPRQPSALLRRNSSFRLLFLASLGSGAGTWLAIVALNVDIFDRTGSGMWLAALNAAAIVPAALLGLFAGSLVDRLSRKRLMIGSDVLRLLVFAALPFVSSPWAIVVLALVAGVGDAFFRPAVLAGLPNLVADEDLPAANYQLQAAQWAATALGPVIGGALVAGSGTGLAYAVNAVSFAVSALLLTRIAGGLLQSTQPLSLGHLRDLREGFGLLRRSYPLVVVFVVWNLFMITSAGTNVAEVVLAKETLDAGAFGYGLMWGATGVGLVLGGLVFRTRAGRSIAVAYPASIALLGVGIGIAAVSPTIWLAAAAMVPAGIGNGVAVACNVTLVQRGAPDRLRGRAFTAIMSANFLVFGAAMLAAGPLTDVIGARWMWGACAIGLWLTAAVAWGMCRGLRAALVGLESPAGEQRQPVAESAAG
jgi:MFS family permease